MIIALIDVAVMGDSRITHKINEKYQKYTDLKTEVQKMWNVDAMIIPLVIGSLGSVPMCLTKHLKALNMYYSTLF